MYLKSMCPLGACSPGRRMSRYWMFRKTSIQGSFNRRKLCCVPIVPCISTSRDFAAWSILSLRSYSVKAKSYYDILEITPKSNATQIKAAYYRLSKKYHPDVNDSSSAKALFTAISEAYDVLGNKQRKRLYDRGLFDPHSIHGSDAAAGPRDATYEEFLKRSGQFGPRKEAPRGKTRIYDFDEFYRQHYGESMDAHIHYKQNKTVNEQEDKDVRVEKKRNIAIYFVLLGVLMWRLLKH